jgi:hypothetical protein
MALETQGFDRVLTRYPSVGATIHVAETLMMEDDVFDGDVSAVSLLNDEETL